MIRRAAVHAAQLAAAAATAAILNAAIAGAAAAAGLPPAGAAAHRSFALDTSAAAVDSDYAAHYSLVSSRIGKHRISLRYEDFYVVDDDISSADDNEADFGRVWMLAYRYNHSALWSVGVEWLQVASWQPALRSIGTASRATERVMQLHFSVRPGARPKVSSDPRQTASATPAARSEARARAYP